MTNEVLEGTVEVPVRAVIDVAAGVVAFGDLLSYMAGGQDHPVSEATRRIGDELLTAAFGPESLADDDARAVEFWARCEEREADLVLEFFGGAQRRATESRAEARRVRAAGTTDAAFDEAATDISALEAEAEQAMEKMDGLLRRIREERLAQEEATPDGD